MQWHNRCVFGHTECVPPWTSIEWKGVNERERKRDKHTAKMWARMRKTERKRTRKMKKYRNRSRESKRDGMAKRQRNRETHCTCSCIVNVYVYEHSTRHVRWLQLRWCCCCFHRHCCLVCWCDRAISAKKNLYGRKIIGMF